MSTVAVGAQASFSGQIVDQESKIEIDEKMNPQMAVQVAVSNVLDRANSALLRKDLEALVELVHWQGDSKLHEMKQALDALVGQEILDPKSAQSIWGQIVGEAARTIDDLAVDGIEPANLAAWMHRSAARDDVIGVRAEMNSALVDGAVSEEELARVWRAAIEHSGTLDLADLRAIRDQIRTARDEGALGADAAHSLERQLGRALLARADSSEVTDAVRKYAWALDAGLLEEGKSLDETLRGVVQGTGLMPGGFAVLMDRLSAGDGEVSPRELERLGEAVERAFSEGVLDQNARDALIARLQDRYTRAFHGNRFARVTAAQPTSAPATTPAPATTETDTTTPASAAAPAQPSALAAAVQQIVDEVAKQDNQVFSQEQFAEMLDAAAEDRDADLIGHNELSFIFRVASELAWRSDGNEGLDQARENLRLAVEARAGARAHFHPETRPLLVGFQVDTRLELFGGAAAPGGTPLTGATSTAGDTTGSTTAQTASQFEKRLSRAVQDGRLGKGEVGHLLRIAAQDGPLGLDVLRRVFNAGQDVAYAAGGNDAMAQFRADFIEAYTQVSADKEVKLRVEDDGSAGFLRTLGIEPAIDGEVATRAPR